jgi:hypothetical protein
MNSGGKSCEYFARKGHRYRELPRQRPCAKSVLDKCEDQHLYTSGRNVNWYSHYRKVWAVFKKF